MQTKPEKTAAQIAFETAQAQIRACVETPEGVVFTWYRSGKVLRWSRHFEAFAVDYAASVEAFNRLLVSYGVAGLSVRGAGKRPERIRST
jgi:hypothetical protein